MLTITGKYNTARLFNDNTEAGSQAQFLSFCNQWWLAEEDIAGMPDAHQGIGVSIGTVCTLRNRRVSAGFVGVDINCGMRVTKLREREIDRGQLDYVVKSLVPRGFNVNNHRVSLPWLRDLTCYNDVNIDRAEHSIGTLGGGNHFIEVGRDEEGSLYLIIHTGSRNIGKEVAEYHQNLAANTVTGETKSELIVRLKAEGRQSEIQSVLSTFEQDHDPDEIPFLEGSLFDNYVNDMLIMSRFAEMNRFEIARNIMFGTNLHPEYTFETVHNYIDFSGVDPILRKGAVSARAGEQLLIPLNREDGCLLCIGKGNPEWLNSAPHGAGRLLSRGEARRTVDIRDTQRRMKEKDIYSTTVDQSTVDESKEAYKPSEEIIACIEPTVAIQHRIMTIYNLKDNTKQERRRKR